jgi:hypothetical protein
MSKSKRIEVLEKCVAKIIKEREVVDADVTKAFGEVGKVIGELAKFLGVRIELKKKVVEGFGFDEDTIVEEAVFSKFPEAVCGAICPKSKSKKINKTKKTK